MSLNSLYQSAHPWTSAYQGFLPITPPSRKLASEPISKSWERFMNESWDSNRTATLDEKVRATIGVYQNDVRMKEVGTENTVLVNVVAYNKQSNSLKYRSLLHNWKCYTDSYGLRPLLYLVPSHEKTYEEQVSELESRGFNSTFMSYPLYLFWSFVSEKKSKIATGSSRVDYLGNIPSFAHFGALVMIVPIFEILLAGHNVIYLDVDVVALRDPIPYLVTGKSDITVSLESRSCFNPSVYNVAQSTDWKKLEPNTGVLHIRSNDISNSIVRKWLNKIVDGNVANDQRVFHFEEFGSRLSFDCNPQLMPFETDLLSAYTRDLEHFYNIRTPKNVSSYPRYCYLNEYLVQNGKVLFHCASLATGNITRGQYLTNSMESPAYPAEYVVAMNQMNFTVYNDTSQQNEKTMTPALVHVNYCGDKINELHKLGMWLPESTDHNARSNVCKSFDEDNILHSKIDWNAKLAAASEELESVAKLLVNGSVIKILDIPLKRMLYNGKMRPILNQESFNSLGLVHEQVHYVGQYNIVMAIPEGKSMPDTKIYNPI